jgi:hypothetical protein
VLDGSRAGPGMRFRPAGLFDLLQIEDGAKGKSLPRTGWERYKFHLRFAGGAGNRAVGGAEVNTDGRDPILRLPHSLYYFSSAVLDIGQRRARSCLHEKSGIVPPGRQLPCAADLRSRPRGVRSG